jgi:hypothetical protein
VFSDWEIRMKDCIITGLVVFIFTFIFALGIFQEATKKELNNGFVENEYQIYRICK